MRTGYLRSSGYLAFLLPLYLICWGCSEGGNVISPTAEMVWYGILDLLAGPVFLFGFLWSLRRVDYGTFGLRHGAGAGGGTGPHMTNTAGTGSGVNGPGNGIGV